MTPEGWKDTTIGQLTVDSRYGTSVKCRPDHFGVPILRIPNVATGRLRIDGLKYAELTDTDLERWRIQQGDILVVRTNGNPDYVGRAIVAPNLDGDWGYASYLIRLRVDANQASPEFVAAALMHGRTREHLRKSIRTSAGNYNLNARGIAGTSILLPPPAEQRSIAAILSSIDAVIEKTEAVIDQLQVVKKAMMQELLTRGLPGRHTRFKQTEVGEIPEDWEVVPYGQLAADVPRAIQSGPFGSALKHSEFVPQGRLVIGIDNVLDGAFSRGADHRITEEKFEELRRFEARPGDLLITVMATVGRCCVVPDDIEPAIITKHVYRLSVDRSRANPYFLMYCTYGVPAVSFTLHGSAQGLSRPGLNKSLLMPLPFPLPRIEEQDSIVASLQAVDRRLQSEQHSIAAASKAKAALMSVLLTGELRVQLDEAVA